MFDLNSALISIQTSTNEERQQIEGILTNALESNTESFYNLLLENLKSNNDPIILYHTINLAMQGLEYTDKQQEIMEECHKHFSSELEFISNISMRLFAMCSKRFDLCDILQQITASNHSKKSLVNCLSELDCMYPNNIQISSKLYDLLDINDDPAITLRIFKTLAENYYLGSILESFPNFLIEAVKLLNISQLKCAVYSFFTQVVETKQINLLYQYYDEIIEYSINDLSINSERSLIISVLLFWIQVSSDIRNFTFYQGSIPVLAPMLIVLMHNITADDIALETEWETWNAAYFCLLSFSQKLRELTTLIIVNHLHTLDTVTEASINLISILLKTNPISNYSSMVQFIFDSILFGLTNEHVRLKQASIRCTQDLINNEISFEQIPIYLIHIIQSFIQNGNPIAQDSISCLGVLYSYSSDEMKFEFMSYVFKLAMDSLPMPFMIDALLPIVETIDSQFDPVYSQLLELLTQVVKDSTCLALFDSICYFIQVVLLTCQIEDISGLYDTIIYGLEVYQTATAFLTLSTIVSVKNEPTDNFKFVSYLIQTFQDESIDTISLNIALLAFSELIEFYKIDTYFLKDLIEERKYDSETMGYILSILTVLVKKNEEIEPSIFNSIYNKLIDLLDNEQDICSIFLVNAIHFMTKILGNPNYSILFDADDLIIIAKIISLSISHLDEFDKYQKVALVDLYITATTLYPDFLPNDNQFLSQFNGFLISDEYKEVLKEKVVAKISTQ